MYSLPPNYDVARHFLKLAEIQEFFRKNPDVTEVDNNSIINEAYNYVTDPFVDWVGKNAYRYGTLLGYEEIPLQCVLNGLNVVLRYGHVFEDLGDVARSNSEALQGYSIMPRTVGRPVQLYRIVVIGDDAGTTFELNKLSGALSMVQGEKRAVEWQLFYDHRNAGIVSHLRWRRVYQNMVMRERSGLALDQYPVMAASTFHVMADLRRRLPPHVLRHLPRETKSTINSISQLPYHMVAALAEVHLKLVSDGYECPQDVASIKKFVERVATYMENLTVATRHAIRKEQEEKS